MGGKQDQYDGMGENSIGQYNNSRSTAPDTEAHP